MNSGGSSVFLETADEAPDGGARGRDSMFLLANLYVGGRDRAVAVKVRNISSGGLMAELPEPLAHDAPIEIDVRGLGRISGRIAWQTEGRAGIAFDRPVDPQRARKPVGTREREGNVRPLRPRL